ncbi:ATP/GTP-binding protein [Methanomethylophilus alvi]|uniref:ATP/GTP-binding protein n=1 Tax=Methanomethylophilus alvi TaxID=1291540 RepID=UPI0037DD53FE
MLRKFSVENYKNFHTKIEIDFTNKRDYSFCPRCVKNGLISKAVIMGHNASGKTNFGYALFDIVYTLTDNLYNPLQKDYGSFINGDSEEDCAKFSYEFQNGMDIIRYEYHKKTPDHIVYEALTVNENEVFVFDYSKNISSVKGLRGVNADTLNFEGLDGSLSALRFIINNTVQSKGSPISFLKDFVGHMLYFRYVNGGPNFIGLHKSITLLEPFIVENGLLKDFQRFLNDCGVPVDLEAVKDPLQTQIVQKFDKKKLLFQPLMSSGTSVLELYYFWSKQFQDVSFLYIDEFDAFYHFDLARKIMQKTIDEVDAQTVFTTHNTYLVSNNLMRPDCYFQIKDGKIVSFADSTERELREAHNLEKMLRSKEFE